MCELGLGSCLVGRSHECDFPESVARVPVCTRAKLEDQGSSRDIDDQVKQLLGSALSIYEIDLELVKELRPDVILTQDQCEVCAVSLTDVEKALADWTTHQPRLVSLSPKRFTDLWTDMFTVAEALKVPHPKDFILPLKLRCVNVIEKACLSTKQPSVACIEWLDPLMAAGNWIPDMVEMAGGQCLFGEAGKHSPWLNWDAIVDHDPEIIILMPCGFDINRTLREMSVMTGRGGWSELRAVKQGRVYVVDGNQYFNRPGPRLVDSLEIFAEIINPKEFAPDNKGTGWEQLSR